MRWLAKWAVQRIIHPLPRSEHINYFFQRRVSRRLPISDDHLLKKAGWAARHLRVHLEHGHQRLEEARTYEFGAGWDLVGPLCFWMAGVPSQTVIDIRSHVRLELVNHAIERMGALTSELEGVVGALQRVPDGPVRSVEDLAERFGIRYIAPMDARRTPFAPGSFDFVTTSDTLEHVPAGDLPAVLSESARLLADGGVMSHLVDLMDHYRYVDDRITVYNFLRFSDRTWRALNSPLEPQNRLRVTDYRRMFEEAGLRIVGEEVQEPTDRDLATLSSMRMAARFRNGYTVEELGVKSVLFKARLS